MGDTREDMAKAIDGQITQLAKIRQIRYVDAAIAVAQSFAENLRDSRGTSMESYWEAMGSIADGIVATETGSR